MNKYLVYFNDGRKCEICANNVYNYEDHIEFEDDEDHPIAWFNTKEIIGYRIIKEENT